ncbi:hypothetical protein AR687_23325 [Flavobacteriaceae bacterium CRH]|nr:hypothetical protein AR687_23325 [Flavobacteriaceae bacterium CRH]
MKKNRYFVIIKYSIKNENLFQYREKNLNGETLIGYVPKDSIFFRNKLNMKLYFINDKIFLKNKLIYCFKDIQYYESLVYMTIDNKEFIYAYPHYYGRVGPYIWYGLGILIEIKKAPIIKEKIDYFEDDELVQVIKFKNFKIKKNKEESCK